MNDALQDLKDSYPDLFKDAPLPSVNWDDFDIIEVDPEGDLLNQPDLGGLINSPQGGADSIWPDTIFGEDIEIRSRPDDIAHGGSLIRYDPHTAPVPPPDALAFYLPYHYYHPHWWGVYILFDGLVALARYILDHAKPRPSINEALRAAHRFLHYHEAFHHSVECFATRIELIDRKPHYRSGFDRVYRSSYGTNNCLEEALGNAAAARWVRQKIKNPAIDLAIQDYMAKQPPGYNQAHLYLDNDAFIDGRNKFAELNRSTCYGAMPHGTQSIWDATGHLFHPMANIRSRVNYLVPKGSTLFDRISGVRPALPANKAIKKLEKLAGLKLVKHGSNHDIYEASNGHKVPIPRHRKDLGKGLLLDILKQAGLDISWSEFHRA